MCECMYVEWARQTISQVRFYRNYNLQTSAKVKRYYRFNLLSFYTTLQCTTYDFCGCVDVSDKQIALILI